MIDLAPYSATKRISLALVLLIGAAVVLVSDVAPSSTEPLSWGDLIAPLAVGSRLPHGFVLSPPRRGEAHDVVFVARREEGPDVDAARVEVHVVDRGQWPDVPETRSFGVAWEMPPRGSRIVASSEEMDAIRDVLLDSVAKNDTGFVSVDSIPLESESAPPLIARVLGRLHGFRGFTVGTLAVLILTLISSIRGGSIVVGVLLFVLGLGLRGVNLDFPFSHDQDVQRLFTGHLPLREIATGAGLQDRHPPLYFLLLHSVEQLGQSEAIVRAPAVLAGALAGPSIMLATTILCGEAGLAASLVGLVVTVSPELILRSREVSEIPLYALIMLGATVSLVAAIRNPRWKSLVCLSLFNGLALFTYYLAPFLIAVNAVVLGWSRPTSWRTIIAFAVGVALGSPALVLAGMTLSRDWGARDVAHAFPALAWGEHTPGQMTSLMVGIVSNAYGAPFLMLVALAMVVGIAKRNLEIVALLLAAAATFAGIALLSPIARVQGYYVTTALPIVALPLAVLAQSEMTSRRLLWVTTLALVVVLSTIPRLGDARMLYLPDADAFMPRFASIIANRPEPSVVTVAHYDTTLLSYYLARREGRAVDWSTGQDGAKHVEPLVMVHFFDDNSEAAAATRLDGLIAAGPILVVERDAVLLPRIVHRLSACDLLAVAPGGRLLRCASPADG